MLSIQGYEVSDLLHKSGRSVVYRAFSKEKNRSVILKMLRNEFPGTEQLVSYQREFEFVNSFQTEGIIKAYGLEKYKNTLVMILEDFGGESLSRQSPELVQDPVTFLKLAIKVTEALGEIHRRNIIHKDINPSNIIWNPESNDLKIIDFGISTELSRETMEMSSPNVMEGTLAYISPEQTGRMNRTVDYRSDLYSLGVTWYELLTGVPPFEDTDPMKLVHCQIAVEPEKVSMRNPQVPEQISRIVEKLLQKNAEDRYQTATGLQIDLELCLKQLQEEGNIQAFTPGAEDFSGRFQIPQKLYGRHKEIQILMDAFERNNSGAMELITVSGYSGVGKTALVHEIHKPITARNGIYISGKFDQFQRDVPYFALRQAFSELCTYLLSEPEDVLLDWKEKILTAVGDEAQVLLDIIPELLHVIGTQAPLRELEHTESLLRLNRAFQQLVLVVSRKDHPLVVFIDDVQWIDSGSLALLENLITFPQLKYFFLICAYRDNEVNARHPFIMSLEEIQKRNIPLAHIELQPLNEEHISSLLIDSLFSDAFQVTPLAELIHQKTGGNAFFVKQFLHTLFTEGMLSYSYPAQKWIWDMDKIKTHKATDNVVDLMAMQISAMKQNTIKTLQLCAAFGNKFDIGQISIISESNSWETLRDLWPAINQGLLIPLDHRYKSLGSIHNQGNGERPIPTNSVSSQFRFIHDRVQEAAYTTIPEAEREKIHLTIARLLFAFSQKNNLTHLIFEIVKQYERGASLLEDESEKNQLADLCLQASTKAIQSSAFESALNFAGFAVEKLLEPNSWETNYDLTWNLFRNKAACEFSTSRIKEGEISVLTALEKSKNSSEKVIIYNIYSHLLVSMNRHQDGIQNSRNALAYLGVKLPKKIGKLNIALQYIKFRLRLGFRKPEYLLKLKETTDPHALNVLRVLYDSMPSAYMAHPDTMGYNSMLMANLCLKAGSSVYAPFAYAMLIPVTAGVTRELKLADRFSKIALELIRRYPNRDLEGRVLLMVGGFGHHWNNPISDGLQLLRKSYHCLSDTGNMNWRNYTIFLSRSQNLFFSSKHLDETIQENREAYELFVESDDREISLQQNHILNFLHRFAGHSDEFVDKTLPLNEDEYAKEMSTPGNFVIRSYYYMLNMIENYSNENYREALDYGSQSLRMVDETLGILSTLHIHFYFLLSYLALENTISQGEKLKLFPAYRKSRFLLKVYARKNPDEFSAFDLLIQAEEARIKKNSRTPLLYARALEAARNTNYHNIICLTNELTAKYYLERNSKELAGHFMTQAHHFYSLWGAESKSRQITAKYIDILYLKFDDIQLSELPGEPEASSTPKRKSFGDKKQPTQSISLKDEVFDFRTLLKINQAISSEIKLKDLLSRLIYNLIENAGAEHGVLILLEDKGLLVQAEGEANQEVTKVLQSTSLKEYKDLAHSVILYVERTREGLVLDDASEMGLYTNDTHIRKKRVRSLMCSPIIHHGELMGIVYLENNLTAGAFTPERLEILSFISSQAAISIVNARLIEENLEKERISAIGQMASGIVHDLKNPIGVIIAYADMIRGDNFPSEEREKFLTRILREAENLTDMTDEILDFVKGKIKLNIQILPIKEYLADVEEFLAPVFEDSKIELEILMKYKGEISIDPNRFRRVIYNIANNARDAMYRANVYSGGKFTIEVNTDSTGKSVLFSFRDNGPGIPAEIQNTIFEPFTTFGKETGTGLGMALALAIVKEHGGEITFHSHKGEGTEFYIHLPF